jgi:hypothetical protein
MRTGAKAGTRMDATRLLIPLLTALATRLNAFAFIWVAYNADKRPADLIDKVQRRA